MKSYSQPPLPVKETMQAVCYILYANPTEKMKSEDGLKMVTDW
jgi:hypothetical protein